MEAIELGRSAQDVGREAKRYLQEMAAEHSELAIDAWETFIRFVVRQYTIDVQSDQLKHLHKLGAKHSLAYLPSSPTLFPFRTIFAERPGW